ncbi:MAG: alpha/beta fold hydrolase [Psychroflexus sp.]|nr:alpha/beta fold hydrolase [Psychroflexus sp.]MDN6309647.1 alpha/beta fold hydrolase [Psychroflexus sp.]
MLQNNHQCHILTLAGFNGQDPISSDKGYLPVIEEGINNYIQNELNQKPILIGHSLGGFLAMSLASDHSEMLDKIIIVDPAINRCLRRIGSITYQSIKDDQILSALHHKIRNHH